MGNLEKKVTISSGLCADVLPRGCQMSKGNIGQLGPAACAQIIFFIIEYANF